MTVQVRPRLGDGGLRRRAVRVELALLFTKELLPRERQMVLVRLLLLVVVVAAEDARLELLDLRRGLAAAVDDVGRAPRRGLRAVGVAGRGRAARVPQARLAPLVLGELRLQLRRELRGVHGRRRRRRPPQRAPAAVEGRLEDGLLHHRLGHRRRVVVELR